MTMSDAIAGVITERDEMAAQLAALAAENARLRERTKQLEEIILNAWAKMLRPPAAAGEGGEG